MLTKEQQLKRNGRLKPKAHKEPAYLKWLHEVRHPPCFVCGTLLGMHMHHVKEHSSDLRDDMFVIPLCSEHHMGDKLSPHGTPKKFREYFPIQSQRNAATILYQEYKGEIDDNF